MNALLLNLSLILNPVLSLFTILYLKVNLKKHYIFIALFMGYIAMLLEPSIDVSNIKSDDVMRHYERFMDYDLNISFFEYLNYTATKIDFFVPLEYYLGNLFGIKKEIIPFISVFLSYYFILKIFISILFKNDNLKNINFLFFALFLLIDFRAAALGIRYYPSICIMIYGLFLYFYKHNFKKCILFMIFANIMHVATMIVSILFIVFLFVKKIINNKNFYLLFYFSFLILFLPNLIVPLLQIVSLLLPIDVNVYFEGYWMHKFLNDLSIGGLIYFFALNCFKFIFCIFAILYLRNKIQHKNFYNFFILCFFFTCCVCNFMKVFERFLYFDFLYSIILWLIYFKENEKINKNILSLIVLFSLFLFLCNCVTMRYFIPETFPKLFYPTIYNIMFDNIQHENFLFNPNINE